MEYNKIIDNIYIDSQQFISILEEIFFNLKVYRKDNILQISPYNNNNKYIILHINKGEHPLNTISNELGLSLYILFKKYKETLET